MAKSPAPAKSNCGTSLTLRLATGRSLSGFGRLSPAEKVLLDCCRRGEAAMISDELPEKETSTNRVRAAFVRFLALGGDERAPIHSRGVQLAGAWLTGLLDLQAAALEHLLVLVGCRIERIEAIQARIKFLNLSGSRLLEGLVGDGLTCAGNVFLRDGFHATGGVRFLGARIEGELDCSGSRFEVAEGDALSCDSAIISGYMFLRDGFHSTGRVNLLGVRIGSNLECGKGRFDNPKGDALNLDRAMVSGNVFLRDSFCATNRVNLTLARIGGSLDCCGGSFANREDKALVCSAARVTGPFFFRDLKELQGGVDLSGMQVGSLCDDALSWDGARGCLWLDGFTYDRLAGSAPTEAATRIRWLDQQYPDHLAGAFRPQPWEQLIAVLKSMGHPEDARNIAIAKQGRLRRAGKIVRGTRPFHWLYGLLVGYGYRPMRVLVTTGSVWLLCFLAYWAATNPAWFGAETHLLAPPVREQGGSRPSPDYGNFVPLIYSADVLLPIIDLGYKDEWQPVVADASGKPLFWGQALRFLYWFEIAFGWVAGLLLVGVLGNLIKKD